jgi:radical SAM superfamily enzyme YgiQ (UPF0313 family)
VQQGLKVALVNPRVESYSSVLPPLGLLYIAAVLEKEGYQVRVFDIYPYDDRTLPELVAYRPEVIGMTLLTDYWPRARQVADFIHKELPGVPFIVGGIHVTTAPEETLTALGAEVAVLGEGERTMLEVCERLSRGASWQDVAGILYRDASGTFTRTPPRPYIENLDDLPLPARHLLHFEEYLMPPGIIRGWWSERCTTVITSRGCPYSCIWCASHCIFGRKVRRRSVANVLGEVEHLIGTYHIDTIWFVDDTFTLHKGWVLEFCRGLTARGIRLAWGCQAHVRTADEAMFSAMKEAGCVQLDFGVESGSNRVLKALKKNSDADTVREAFRIAKKAGIRTMATFMFGSPSEDREDVEATMCLAREIRPDFASSFYITPYPGTELMQMAQENGWQMHWTPGQTGLKKTPPLTIRFSAQELQQFRARFQKMFVYRNCVRNLLRPQTLVRAGALALRYPMGLVYGVRKFLQTFVLDDLFFEFLVYYVKKRTERMIKARR